MSVLISIILMIVWKEFTPSYIPMFDAVKYTTNQT
jgi:hypothetical protein